MSAEDGREEQEFLQAFNWEEAALAWEKLISIGISYEKFVVVASFGHEWDSDWCLWFVEILVVLFPF